MGGHTDTGTGDVLVNSPRGGYLYSSDILEESTAGLGEGSSLGLPRVTTGGVPLVEVLRVTLSALCMR